MTGTDEVRRECAALRARMAARKVTRLSAGPLRLVLPLGTTFGVAAIASPSLWCAGWPLIARTVRAAIVAASATAFAVVKWVGVACLLWIGIQALRSRARGSPKVWKSLGGG